MDALRVAVIGLDSASWPFPLAEAIKASLHAVGVALFDLGLPRQTIEPDLNADLDAFVEMCGMPLVHDLDEAIADAVFLSSRNTVIPGLAARLIDAGKHVFAAKPMALTAEDAKAYLREGSRVSSSPAACSPPPGSRTQHGDASLTGATSVRSRACTPCTSTPTPRPSQPGCGCRTRRRVTRSIGSAGTPRRRS